jgi:hypothetical protein
MISSGGWSEVPEGWEAPGSDHAPTCPALAPATAGKLNAKLKSDFRCYPNNGHAATASPVRFVPKTEVDAVIRSGFAIT